MLEGFINAPFPHDAAAPIAKVTSIVGSNDADIVVSDTSWIPVGVQVRVRIDDEIIIVQGSSASTMTPCLRGVENTARNTHAIGAGVFPVLTAGSLAVNPRSMTTLGDMEYFGSTGVPTRIPSGNDNQFLGYSGGIPVAKSRAITTLGDIEYANSVGGFSRLAAGGNTTYIGYASGVPVIHAAMIVNVKDFGALGDGSTDDRAAIDAAETFLNTNNNGNGGIIFFPPGIYAFNSTDGIIPNRNNITYRGAGMYQTTLKQTSGSNMVTATLNVSGIVFEDMTLDKGNTGISAITYYGVVGFSIRRCRFIGLAGCQAISITGGAGGPNEISDCIFQGAGGQGAGISLGSGVRDLVIQRNRFFWMKDCIIGDTGVTSGQEEQVIEFLQIRDNYFDSGWWLTPARFSGSGANVSFTSTVLTDTGATFSGISQFDNVRVMPVKQTGTYNPQSTTLKVLDASATFLTNQVKRGDILRTGTSFAVVRNVENETTLWVETWLSDSNRYPIVVPSSGAYTIYGIVIGSIQSSTGTTLTVSRWHDYDGATASVPASGTLYEVIYRPNYHINLESSTRYSVISRNVLRRGWSDQVSVFGYRTIVSNNQIEDGEDMGITIHGDHNVVSGNHIRHQGAGGIFTGANNSVYADNNFSNTPWVNPNVASGYIGHIILFNASRNIVSGNRGERGTANNGFFGISVYSSGVGLVSDGNLLTGNHMTNHTLADILVRGSNTTNTRVYDNIAAILKVDTGATLSDQRGLNGAPSAANAGTGATIAGSDHAGTITIGSTPGTPIITFKHPLNAAPVVILQSSSANLVRATSVNATAFTISGTIAQNDIISWMRLGTV